LVLLSDQLREDLKHETTAHHLSAHPLFHHCDERTRVFGRALSAAALAHGDMIFTCGEQARRVVFVSSGALEYTLGEVTDSPQHGEAHGEVLRENKWVCEAVLWTPWLHLGDLLAVTESQIVSVDAASFSEAVQINKPLWHAVHRYADKFVRALNEVSREDLTDLCDQLFHPDDAIDKSDFDLGPSLESSGGGEQPQDGSVFGRMCSVARHTSALLGRDAGATSNAVVVAGRHDLSQQHTSIVP